MSIIIILPLKWLNPPTSAVMLATDFNTSDSTSKKASDNYYQWRNFEDISPYLAVAVIASEDQKFLQHNGFDFDAIWTAIKEPRTRKRGASTISQQVVKNLYLYHGRSYFRKAIEAVLTVSLELLLSKKRILTLYLNVAEMAPNIYGAEMASKKIFGIHAKHLTAYQSALITATLPNPKKMSASNPSDYVKTQAAKIYQQIFLLGGTGLIKKFN